ncbi:hypothetical protein [uncultured Draconibacterium sp.]|uniref:hypothetical protein n=1 Tax=uncultured Draconibacterium sp. TaxID=1573823 RepID=UPI0029C6E113|nr:hypothetical protein [uncultured Draconibacterium sp.]
MRRDILCKYGVIFVLLFVITISNSGKLLLIKDKLTPKNSTLFAHLNFQQGENLLREDFLLQKANTYLSKAGQRKQDNPTKNRTKQTPTQILL